MSSAYGSQRDGSWIHPESSLRCILVVLLLGFLVCPVFGCKKSSASSPRKVLVEPSSPMTYLVNTSPPGVGMAWKDEAFDDSSWRRGSFGVGYDTDSGAERLLRTNVGLGTASVYARTTFILSTIPPQNNLFLGLDYDDGVVVWINGVEVYRSPEMPADPIAWNTTAATHESSNSGQPEFDRTVDITEDGIPALKEGLNTMALGVWNDSVDSTDLVVVPQLTMTPPTTVVRGPYLQMGTSSSVVVRWRTDFPTSSTVSYGTTPLELDSVQVDTDSTTEHEVRLDGLDPDTLYYYSVGTSTRSLLAEDEDHFFRTSPVPGTPRPTRVWILGDSGTANDDAMAVRDAYYSFAQGDTTDVWLMLGDNAYPDGTDGQYQRAVFDMYPEMLSNTVLWSTLGNHDGKSAQSRTQSGTYYDVFTLPRQGEAGGIASGTEAYYSFDYGNIHFVCLDSHETDRSPDGAMMAWLEQDLAETLQEWIIAFWHHAPYSKGSHNSDTEGRHIEMRETALPLLEDGGVDLVLSGHSHSYERSFLIDGHYGKSKTFVSSMLLDGGDGRDQGDGAYEKPSAGPAPHEGAVYVVAGSSGKVSRRGALDHPVMYIALQTLGSVVLDVDGQRLDAQFLDSEGAVQDSFTILKGAAALQGTGEATSR